MKSKQQNVIGWSREQLEYRGFEEDAQGRWIKTNKKADPLDKVIKQAPLTTLPVKRSKYGNKRVTVMNHQFDSIKESQHYLLLVEREQKFEINNLKLQQKFEIIINGLKVCTYIADFTYMENGESIVVDVKGMKTAIYRLKKKLLKAVLNIDIKEV